jgi:hypothetical protein
MDTGHGYAFIMPGPSVQREMEWFQRATKDFRPDQIARIWHLMHSWGCKPGMLACYFFPLMRRAIKNTLNNLP